MNLKDIVKARKNDYDRIGTESNAYILTIYNSVDDIFKEYIL